MGPLIVYPINKKYHTYANHAHPKYVIIKCNCFYHNLSPKLFTQLINRFIVRFQTLELPFFRAIISIALLLIADSFSSLSDLLDTLSQL